MRPEVVSLGGVARSELMALLTSPLGWGVAAAFTLLVSIFGFIGPVLSSQQARLDGVYGLIPGYLLVILAPLVAIGANGMTSGWDRSWRRVAGKWLGAFTFYCVDSAPSQVNRLLGPAPRGR